jgi:hypothetical protein
MSSAFCGSPTDMTERDPILGPFGALIGTWVMEAAHPQVDAVVPGIITLEWLEGGHLIVQRSQNEHELFPETGGGLVMEYFDSRGVRRAYGVSLDDGASHLARPPRARPALHRHARG